MKVILHVDEEGKLEVALGNIKNLLNLNKNITIELLINGKSVVNLKEDYAKKHGIINELNDVFNKGVIIAVCNNSLNKFNIDKNELLNFVKVVPAGIMELIEKQNEGFAYVKP
ncbi:DsrE family protein [Clostridium sp.]|uniref:DsrE family protein n=1 Tax=Clostridium sp. TaxID=1506 RepID=UPI0026DAA78D|nr:DsrE family protein [Clostridium sp.]MDO5039632.1 DsrE family protein [Clostridium sp.]